MSRKTAKDVPEAGGDVAYAYDLRGLQLSALYSATGLGIASAYDKAVRAARAELRHLREQRRDDKPGIDARAKATQTALRSHFGSSINSVLRAVDRNLGNVETFLSDPGRAAGGMFDYRAPTIAEIKAGGLAGIGFYNPLYRPNTVALNIQADDAPVEILRTLVHEPLHVFGMGAPWLGEQYRGSAIALANVRGGTASAVYDNPDNYACFVFSGC